MATAVFSLSHPPLLRSLRNFVPCRLFLQKAKASAHKESNIKESTQSPLFYTPFITFFQVIDKLSLLSIHSLSREGRDHCSHQVGMGTRPQGCTRVSQFWGHHRCCPKQHQRAAWDIAPAKSLMSCLTSALKLVQSLLSKHWVAFIALQDVNISRFFPAERMEGPRRQRFPG